MDEFGKVGADVSYLQSQMHSEYDSAESIADADLEDGELQKMLASPLYLQNREDYESSPMPIATEKFAALFSYGSEEQGNQFKSSVFKKTLTRQIWEDLFLKAVKIICSVKKNLNL